MRPYWTNRVLWPAAAAAGERAGRGAGVTTPTRLVSDPAPPAPPGVPAGLPRRAGRGQGPGQGPGQGRGTGPGQGRGTG